MKAQLIKETTPTEIWWKVIAVDDNGKTDVKCFNESFIDKGKAGEERARDYFEAIKKSTLKVIVEEWDSSTNQTT